MQIVNYGKLIYYQVIVNSESTVNLTQYIICIVHCTMYNVQCTVYNVFCRSYCTLYTVQYITYSVEAIVQCTMYSI